MTRLATAALLVSLALLHRPAEANRFLTSGICRARSLAMGSAYYSMADGFSAGLFNPGAFRADTFRDRHPWAVFFNPVASGAALFDYAHYDRDYRKDDGLTAEECFSAAAFLLKGAVFTTHYFDVGFALSEEIVLNDSLFTRRGSFFSAEGLTLGLFNSAFVDVKVSPTLSVGASGTLYKSRLSGRTTYRGGYALGVLLTPNPKLNVGIVYNQIPNDFSSGRFNLESIESETFTSGISYHLDDDTVISVDLRNLNKEDKHACREIHTGFERFFFKQFALRAGYFRKKLTKNDVYSLGIGILPSVNKLSKNLNIAGNDLLSYTAIIEENGDKYFWHVLSLLLRY